MKIDVYSNMYNEEKILPYWLRHYETFADRIFIWDDHSTDSTLKILKEHPKVTLLPREKHGHDDTFYVTSLYPEYEKYSQGVSDWVIIADADEFVYHPKIREVLEEYGRKGTPMLQCAGYSVISNKFPTTSGQIYDELKMGFKDFLETKWTIHSSNIHVRFRKGRHGAPINSSLYPRRVRGSGIKLLHYRYLGRKYIDGRNTSNDRQTRIPYPDAVTKPNIDKAKEHGRPTGHNVCTCPNLEVMNIFDWLKKHKGEEINVLKAK